MIWFAEENQQGRQALVYCDDQQDVQNDLEQFAEDNHLKKGAKCLIIETHQVLFLNSRGEWK